MKLTVEDREYDVENLHIDGQGNISAKIKETPKKVWKPKNCGMFYYISADLSVHQGFVDVYGVISKTLNCFRTREHAEHFRDFMVAHLKRFHAIKAVQDWDPCWDDLKEKYFISPLVCPDYWSNRINSLCSAAYLESRQKIEEAIAVYRREYETDEQEGDG